MMIRSRVGDWWLARWRPFVGQLVDAWMRFYWRVFRYRVIGADRVLYHVTERRRVFISGVHGAGKTMCAVALSYLLFERGIVDFIFAPIPVRGQSFDWSVGARYAMILDETHTVLNARHYMKNNVNEWTMDLRKREAVLFAPSVTNVDKEIRTLEIEARVKLGNLAWFYVCWDARGDEPVKLCSFWIVFPFYLFGSYAGKYTPTKKGVELMLLVANNEKELAERNEAALKGWEEFADHVGY